MQTRPYKRRRYIVDSEFQYGLIKKFSVFCILMILMSLCFLCLIYIRYGDVQFHLFQPDPFDLSGGVNALTEQRTILDVIWPVLGVCLTVTLLLSFFFGVLISHRIAGPIFRIRRILGDMAAGNLKGEVRLRKKDELKSLAASINGVKKEWRGYLEKMQKICIALESDDVVKKNKHVKELQEILNTFQY